MKLSYHRLVTAMRYLHTCNCMRLYCTHNLPPPHTHRILLPPVICRTIITTVTPMLNRCLTNKPKMAVRATSIRRQAPRPNISVTALHSEEYISLNPRQSSQGREIRCDWLKHSRKLDTEDMVPFWSAISSQLEKQSPNEHIIATRADKQAHTQASGVQLEQQDTISPAKSKQQQEAEAITKTDSRTSVRHCSTVYCTCKWLRSLCRLNTHLSKSLSLLQTTLRITSIRHTITFDVAALCFCNRRTIRAWSRLQQKKYLKRRSNFCERSPTRWFALIATHAVWQYLNEDGGGGRCFSVSFTDRPLVTR